MAEDERRDVYIFDFNYNAVIERDIGSFVLLQWFKATGRGISDKKQTHNSGSNLKREGQRIQFFKRLSWRF